MRNNKNLLTFSIVFAGIAISGSLIFFSITFAKNRPGGDIGEQIQSGIEQYIAQQSADAQKAQEEANKPQPVKGDFVDDDASLGDSDAPVTLIEFSDFQCPFCRKFYNEAFPKIKEKYIDTGKVRFVYRDFPLDFHSGAKPAAAAAECAREQGDDATFFAMHDKIFDGQNKLGAGTVDIPDENIQHYARELNLNIKEFNECTKSERIDKEIAKDITDGISAGVSRTPGFLLNNLRIEGAQPFSYFEPVIEAELSK